MEKVLALAVALWWLAAGASKVVAAVDGPVVVSPGDASNPGVRIESACPTFSWSRVEGAARYELRVYRVGEGGEERELQLGQRVAGSASAWTPSLERCLERGGRYAWSVRAVLEAGASDWSLPASFAVAASRGAGTEAATAALREALAVRDPARARSLRPKAADAPEALVGEPGQADSKAGPVRVAAAATVSDTAVLPIRSLDCRAGRYQDNGNGTVTDCRGGLIWLKQAACFSQRSWPDAKAAAAGLYDGSTNGTGNTDCSLSDGSVAGDWRLPTITEWMALVTSARARGFTAPALTDAQGSAPWDDGDAFWTVLGTYYWSSSPGALVSFAWNINLETGAFGQGLTTDLLRAWPVRDDS